MIYDVINAAFRMTQKHYLEGQVYSVPLIQPDVRREESVHQIADALLYLETISTDIFRRQVQNLSHSPLIEMINACISMYVYSLN